MNTKAAIPRVMALFLIFTFIFIFSLSSCFKNALIQGNVEFHRLGLAVIDEQHKFGVIQRALLKKKGGNPDVLVMTATPIPRTLAMTVYGDLDVSVIDEIPGGRMPIRRGVFPESARQRVYRIVEDEISKGRQAFIVYPLVKESEKLDLKDDKGAWWLTFQPVGQQRRRESKGVT